MHAKGTTIEEWSLKGGEESLTLNTEKIYSIYVLEGSLSFNHQEVSQDDFIILSEADAIHLKGNARLFVISSPAHLNYVTYQEMMQQRFANR